VQEKHPKAQEIKIPRLSKPYRKSQKKNSDPESPDTSVGKTKDDDESDSDPNFRTNAGLKAQLFPKEGDGYVDPTFHGPDFGLPVHATKSDLDELLQRGREYDSLQMQLCISQTANKSNPSSQQTVQIVSDMSSYHITNERVNAEGFRKLREKCESETRANRECDRNLLISADAQKLIGQMLAAKKVTGFAQWKAWKDAEFFEAMSKIYPAGKTKEIKHLQDFLSKTRCDWFLDNHPGSLLTFVAEVNEGTRVYSSELDNAREKGFIDAVQREAVATLMNRVNSGNGYSKRQPSTVRSRLKTRIMFEGKPKDIDEFILRLLTEADVIATANAEMTACGVNCRPIGKVGDRNTGQQGQQNDNAGKDKGRGRIRV
jgi:hypothetical protein